MRRLTPQTDAVQHRIALGLLGLLGLASAEVCALLARSHATLNGVICGGGQAASQIVHCAWCYAAAGFAMTGAAAMFAAASPIRARAARALPRSTR